MYMYNIILHVEHCIIGLRVGTRVLYLSLSWFLFYYIISCLLNYCVVLLYHYTDNTISHFLRIKICYVSGMERAS